MPRHTNVRRGASRVVTRACRRSADVRCWRTDRRRSAVFGLRRYVRGAPNGNPGRRPDGGWDEGNARPDDGDGRRITARSRARTASRMVPGVAVTSGCVRRAGRVVRCGIGRSRVRNAHRCRPNRVGNTIVHRARMQCRWLLLDYEGPGRKDRGDRATTRSPHHLQELRLAIGSGNASAMRPAAARDHRTWKVSVAHFDS